MVFLTPAEQLVASLDKLVVSLRDNKSLNGPWYHDYDRDRDRGERVGNENTADRLEAILNTYSINTMREL